MKHFVSVGLVLAIILAAFAWSYSFDSKSVSAQEGSAMTVEGHIFEIAIRRVVDQENYAIRQAALNEAISGVDGFIATREYEAFFGIPTIEEGQRYTVGISEWESLDAYTAAAALVDDPEVSVLVAAYFETIESVQNIIVQPFVKGEVLSVIDLAQEGQVLELAVRAISGYDDPVDFLRTIRGFTHQLTALEGVVREYEWISVDGQYFVGMTQYESMETFGAASQNEGLLSHPSTVAMFSTYPPLLAFMTMPHSQ